MAKNKASALASPTLELPLALQAKIAIATHEHRKQLEKSAKKKSVKASKSTTKSRPSSGKTARAAAKPSRTKKPAAKNKARPKTKATRKTARGSAAARRANGGAIAKKKKAPVLPEDAMIIAPNRPRARARPRRVSDKQETLRYVPDYTLKGNIEPYQEQPGELYMCENQLNHFRSILLAELGSLNDNAEVTRGGIKTEQNTAADPLDQAQLEATVENVTRTREREQRLMSKIKKSIELIDQGGTYGYCQSCKNEIGIRRLEARPTATQCISCKELNDMEERQYT